MKRGIRLVYVLLEFPFGVFSFTLAIVLITVSVLLILYPVWYAVAQAQYHQIPLDQVNGHMWPGVVIDGHFDVNTFAAFFLVSAVGLALGAASRAVFNGTGWLRARRSKGGRSS